MLTAIFSRLFPYTLVLLLAAGIGDYCLGKVLLDDQEQIGAAQQRGDTRVAQQALQSSQTARTAQHDADQATIKQLQGALGRETKAAADRQDQLNRIKAADAALNQELANVYSLSPDAKAWGLGVIPDVVLDDPGLCWWSAATGDFSGGCTGADRDLRQPAGSGPAAVPTAVGSAGSPQ